MLIFTPLPVSGHIVVCSLDRAVCLVLDNKNENPRGIDIHYRRSLLFYSGRKFKCSFLSWITMLLE